MNGPDNSELYLRNRRHPQKHVQRRPELSLGFNPGLAVYIFPNVCSTISFGLGGIEYTKIKQKDADGNEIGQRTASKMRFRLNLLNIRIGVTVHLWNKKANKA